MNSAFRAFALLTVGLGIGVFGGCQRSTPPSGSGAGDANTAVAPAAGGAETAVPASAFLEKSPDGAKSVEDVKKDAAAGQEVVVRGRIGGRVDPFVEGRAIFTLADESMKSCNELHADQCPTPWDYCCEPKDSLTAKTLTVQLVGSDGRPLKAGLKGQHGLNPLEHVVIAGRVASAAENAVVIDATGIYVEPKQ